MTPKFYIRIYVSNLFKKYDFTFHICIWNANFEPVSIMSIQNVESLKNAKKITFNCIDTV